MAEVLPSAVPIPVAEPIGSGDRERSSGVLGSMREGGVASRKHRAVRWRRLVREYAGESSVLEQDPPADRAERGRLAGDLCPAAAGPFVLRVEPLAQWVFQRWNIAGMTLFKFGVIGGVIVIGEVAERRRPGLGRGLMAVSCLATAVVVAYGLVSS